MKQPLLILSDLWGIQKATYLPHYIKLLEPKYDIEFIDSCKIGQVDTNDFTQENLHLQFINSGIDLAVDHLVKNYKEEVDILAFSIGGTIAWKANLAGLKVRNFYAVSATRLRYETTKPTSNICLVYGKLDAYRPKQKWFKEIAISDCHIIENEGHNLYQKPFIIQTICNLL